MRILRHYRNPPADAQGAVVALGNFDGVHLGHRALIHEARRIAEVEDRPLAVLVFEPHPREFFRPNDEPFRLTPFRAKAHLLSQEGIDFLIVLAFDAELASKSPQDFVLEILVNELRVNRVLIGGDFRFGKGRAGDAAVLSYMGEMEGFSVTVFAPVSAGRAAKISSSEIRTALKTGHPEEAARLLGHWWSVEGHVAPGDKRGRAIGFPTANLRLERMLQPAFGVYAVRARVHGGDKVYEGVANFGLRPMFALPSPLLEVHLFDFSGELYGELLEVELIAYLRDEANFQGLDALKAAIAADCEIAKAVLKETGTEVPPLVVAGP